MGFLPQRPAGPRRSIAPAPPPDPSLFFQLIEHLNRPSSASLGALAGGLQGGVGGAIEGAKRGFVDVDRGGREVVSALTGAPLDSPLSRRAGLALDVINPLDPLNLVGIGGLTKLGRSAKLLSKIPGAPASSKLAGSFGAQAKAGQRGLLNFAGQRIPIPGDAAALQGLENTRKVIAQSKLGRAIQKNFGGSRGAVLGALDDPADRMIGEILIREDGVVKGPSRRFAGETEPLFRKINALNRKEGEEMGDIIDLVNNGTMDINQARVRFIGTGSRGATRRAAFEAAEQLQPLLKDFSSTLEGTGIDQFLGKDLGFLPRVSTPIGDAPLPGAAGMGDAFGVDSLTGEVIKLKGQSLNAINRGMVPRSIQPINANTFNAEGQKLFAELGYTKGFIDESKKRGPAWTKAFMEKHRLTKSELQELLKTTGHVERRAPQLLKNLQSQVMQNVEMDDLTRRLKDGGIAVPYDKGLHAGDDWVKIDQGRFGAEPLALPKQWDMVIQKVIDATMPSQNTPIMGQFLRDWLPKRYADLGIVSWWKMAAIFGANPLAYLGRNMGTGVHKNAIEGLSPALGQGLGLANTQFYWGRGLKMAGQWARHGKPAGDDLLTLPRSGVQVSEERLRQMYRGMNFHGGGLPDLDVIERLDNASSEARARFYEHAFGHVAGADVSLKTALDFSEQGIRIPLMLKILDDSYIAAKGAGVKVPKVVNKLDDAGQDLLLRRHAGSMANYKYELPEGIGNINTKPALPIEPFEEFAGINQASFENAREAVIRAHFDYNDLSPIERKLRASWIPFYTWTRKNLPSESVNMITNFGQYMPWVRAYYRAFETNELTPEDLPEWSQKLFAVPVHNEESNTVKFMDMTGFLPFMDVFELGSAAFGEPRHGGSQINEAMAWGLNNANPFLGTAFELGLQKDLFTQRDFQGDLPKEFLGAPVSQNTFQILQNLRPITDIDRLNPPLPGTDGKGAFTKLAEITGALAPTAEDRRPGRNEPGAVARAGRFLTGIPLREQERQNLTRKQVRRINGLKGRIRKAEKDGQLALARKLREEVERIQ